MCEPAAKYQVMVYEPLTNPGGMWDWFIAEGKTEREALGNAVWQAQAKWPDAGPFDVYESRRLVDLEKHARDA